jgi:hypothetical protein
LFSTILATAPVPSPLIGILLKTLFLTPGTAEKFPRLVITAIFNCPPLMALVLIISDCPSSPQFFGTGTKFVLSNFKISSADKE